MESFFSLTGRYGAGSPLLGTRGRAGAAHPGSTSSQRRSRAAVRACVGLVAWWRRAPPLEVSSCTPLQAPRCCECHTTYGSRQSGRLPVGVAGGPAPAPRFCALLQRRREHRLLPPPLILLADVRQRACRCILQILSSIALFDSRAYRRLPHIMQKLLMTRVRCAGCEGAKAKHVPRVFFEADSGRES